MQVYHEVEENYDSCYSITLINRADRELNRKYKKDTSFRLAQLIGIITLAKNKTKAIKIVEKNKQIHNLMSNIFKSLKVNMV